MRVVTTKMDTQSAGVWLDNPVSEGHKYGGLIHQSVFGREADSLTL
jgi:hypothetical protein